MERNVRLYPLYQAARSSTFWLPVFILYFSSRFDAAEVLLLEAIYYASVVLMEVPSGYLSDRVGRRPTLLLAASAWALGYAALAFGGTWWMFAAGQVAIAAGMAFNSGTDSALVFDSLSALGRENEVAAVEGKAQSWSAIAMALSALAGGLLASIDLRLGHALSAAGATVAFGVAWFIHEPTRLAVALRPWAQLRGVAESLRSPALRWLFVFSVVMTVFNHVPYELAQPYLGLVLANYDADGFTPAASGVMMALMMGVAAVASRISAPLSVRIGVAPVLLGAMLVQGIVLAGLAALVHPVVVLLLLARSVPGALSRPLELQCVLPNVLAHQRATYLSVQSLAGRLAFTGALATGSWVVGSLEGLGAPAISRLAGGAGVALLIAAAVLTWTRQAIAAGVGSPSVSKSRTPRHGSGRLRTPTLVNEDEGSS